MRESDDESEPPSAAASPSSNGGSSNSGSSGSGSGSGKKKRKLDTALAAAVSATAAKSDKKEPRPEVRSPLSSLVDFVVFCLQLDRDRADVGITYMRQILEAIQRIEKTLAEATKTQKVCELWCLPCSQSRHTHSAPTRRK